MGNRTVIPAPKKRREKPGEKQPKKIVKKLVEVATMLQL
jgi:hypothetical protein